MWGPSVPQARRHDGRCIVLIVECITCRAFTIYNSIRTNGRVVCVCVCVYVICGRDSECPNKEHIQKRCRSQQQRFKRLCCALSSGGFFFFSHERTDNTRQLPHERLTHATHATAQLATCTADAIHSTDTTTQNVAKRHRHAPNMPPTFRPHSTRRSGGVSVRLSFE